RANQRPEPNEPASEPARRWTPASRVPERRGWDSNPRGGLTRPLAFQASSLSHSDTSPGVERLATLGNEIERIRQLEAAVDVAAREVALLVPDVGDDPVALLLDRRALAALERDRCVGAGLEEDPLKVRVPGVGEVLHSQRLDKGRAASDREHRDSGSTRLAVQVERRRDRRLVGARGRDNQRPVRIAEVVGLELGVIRKGRLVDVEHDREVRTGARGGAALLLALRAAFPL